MRYVSLSPLVLRSAALGLGLLLFPSCSPAPPTTDVLNAVVGDAGFVEVFGRTPTAADAEATRIRAHLGWVERRLRARDVRGLAPAAQAERAHLLDALAAYRAAGAFPRNTTRPERTPVFIDAAGRICAVGHLVERSAGRAAAERIAAAHRYSLVAEMPAGLLDGWAAAHGFTLTELPMIQPGYQEPQPQPAEEQPMPIALEVGAMGAAYTAAIVAVGESARGRRSPFVAGAALGLGAAALGLNAARETRMGPALVAAGGVAVLAGAWNLFRPSPPTQAADGRPTAALGLVADERGRLAPGVGVHWSF